MSQPTQSNPRYIKVPGTDRVYDRNKMLLVLLVPLMMSLLQVSSVNNALAAMGQALSASDSQLQWVLSGYALAFGIVLIPSGRIGDIFGRSSIFVIGLVVFTFASLMVGLASSAIALNVMRLMQGFGAGVFSPQTTGLIQQYFEGQARARAFSLFGLVISMSVAAGPVLSGGLIALLGSESGWRWSFIINFPIGIVGIILAFIWLPFARERRHVGPNREQAKREYVTMQRALGNKKPKHTRVDLDPVGMLLVVAATVGIMFPFMSSIGGWIWALVPTGFLLVAVWVYWEQFYASHGHEPMVDLSLFKIKTFSFSAGITALQFMGTTSIFVTMALFLQRGLGASALAVGLVSLPNSLLAAWASIWSGKRAVEHGRGLQVMALTAMLAGVLGAILVIWGIQHGISFWWLVLPITLLGFGQGSIGSANQTQSMLDVPPEHGGTAGAVVQTGQRITTAIGNAVITAVFFLGQRVYPGDSGWYMGIILAYVIVSFFIILAAVVAILFWRDGYRDRHQRRNTAPRRHRTGSLRLRSLQRSRK